jgi:hypothetical protein
MHLDNLLGLLLLASLLPLSSHQQTNTGLPVVNNKLHVTDSYPKLLYLVPKDYQLEYTLNEKDSLTNKVKTGWVLHENENLDFLAFIVVAEAVETLDDIQDGYVFFTTNFQNCDLSAANSSKKNKENSDLFKLKFLKGRSKFSNLAALNIISRRPRRWTPSSDVDSAAASTTTTVPSSLIVAEFNLKLTYQNEKYFTCLHFSKKSKPADQDQDDDDDDSIALKFQHQGTGNAFTHIITTKDLLPIYLVCIFYFVLLCFSALFSGLNLGLMSLDLTELNLLKRSGNKNEKKYATKIYPLRKKGNRLLCTILLGNVLVNSTSTLILGNYLEGAFAALGSTMLIVMFGEIIPQAICSRHGLAIGTHTRYITYAIMALTFVVSYPMGKLLDFFLGEEIAVTFSRDKIRELMRQAQSNYGEGIKEDQFKLIAGALDFKRKTVKDIMVPIKEVFSLDINSVLDFETFKTILYHGYSRIPVSDRTK